MKVESRTLRLVAQTSSLPVCFGLLLFLGLWASVVPWSHAAVIDAANVSYTEISNKVATATHGDIIRIPAGSASWSSGLIISNKNIRLIGAGFDLTIITNEVPKTSPETPMIRAYTTLANGVFRISGIRVKGGITSTQETTDGIIRLNGDGRSNIIDRCFFDRLWGTPIGTEDFTLGVICSNSFAVNGTHPAIFGHGTWQPFNGRTNSAGTPYTKGNGSWADDAYWGTDRFFFFERNYMENVEVPKKTRACDAFDGARYVARFNIGTNLDFSNHGTEGQGRGCKQMEEYNNDLRIDGVTDGLAQIRSGSLICASNIYNGFTKGHVLRNYRQIVWRDGGWGLASGTNTYDSNLPNTPNAWYEEGTHTGANGASQLQDTTKSWTSGQWEGTNYCHILRNVTHDTGIPVEDNSIGTITSNTGTTISFLTSSPNPLRFNTGDTYRIFRMAEAIDQPGLGKDDNGFTAFGPPSTPAHWPAQEVETIYSWANTFNVETTQPNITNGRHYTNGVAKPGWTPYTYPHPLTVEATISPTTATKAAGQTQQFTGGAGSGSYILFEIVANNSGGSINAGTGLYTAGSTPALDTVRVTDSWGNTADAVVTVTSGGEALKRARRRFLF